MTQAVEVLVLVQRLRREAAQRGDSELANDLRLACRYLRQYAAQWIAVEAERTRDPWRAAPTDSRGGRLVEALNPRGGNGASIWPSVGVADGLHKADNC